MQIHTSRGFIPLVAIVLLGLVAMAGGAIAVVSIHNKTASKEAQTAVTATSTLEQTTATADTAYSAPVSARVQSSGAGTTKSASDAPSTPVAQISATLDAETAQDCQEAKSDLAETKNGGKYSGYSLTVVRQITGLLQNIVTACNTLNKSSSGTPDEATTANQKADIKQQFNLYQQIVASQQWDTSLLQSFVADPTPDGYKTLCAKGESVDVPLTKEVLSPDRTTMTKVPETVADIMRCDLVTNADYEAVAVGTGFMQWDLASDDSDSMRQDKIYYAQNLDQIIGSAKVVLVYPKTDLDSIMNPATQRLKPGPLTDVRFDVIPLDTCAQKFVDNPPSVGRIGIGCSGGSLRVHGSERQ